MNEIYVSMLSMGLLGGALGLGLAYASRKFAVEVDPRAEKIEQALPGANCGACGYPGCSALAKAIADDKAPVNACPVGGSAVAEKVAAIMGKELEGGADKQVAKVKCGGGRRECVTRATYEGVESCHAANSVAGGPKGCPFGCLGYGTCEKACPFGAITMNDDGLPGIDPEICTGCGVCVPECPRGVLELVPVSKEVHVLCKSTDKGALVRKVCQAGCIGCRKCEKVCPVEAIKVENNLAWIDYEKCINCGKCAKECPVSCITLPARLKKKQAVTA